MLPKIVYNWSRHLAYVPGEVFENMGEHFEVSPMPVLLSLYPKTESRGRWILGILDRYLVQGKKYVDLDCI